ncbi:MAG: DUF2167 domain-containing protein [Cardiobacteriaceae bacterium]|nr:DUF2167 domain-containing protein [Cardiobacteriaceae bacterium]
MKKFLHSLTLLAALSSNLLITANAQTAEQEKRIAEIQSQGQVGPKTIELGPQASLQLPKDMLFIDKKGANEIMEIYGNTVDPERYGIIFSEDQGWLADLTYIESGYIKDDDAQSWNIDELLQNIKDSAAEQNKTRMEKGIPKLNVGGWIEKPRYDKTTHRLIWSIDTRQEGDSDPSINYNTFILGRYGFISLNFVTDLADIEQDKPIAQQILSSIEFHPGQRYSDFNSSTDKIAEYGLAALIGGIAAKKLGLIAVIVAFTLKFSKILIVAAVGLIYGIKKFFGRNRSDD